MKLALEDITLRVGNETYLYEISLTPEPGLNVLLGPTLAGKTSLMRVMAGLDKPACGRVLVGGRDVTGVGVQKRSVAMVYQQFVNYPSFTVFENIASPLRIRGGLPPEDIRKKVRQVAELMHIENLLDRLPSALSGRQQQRTAIARALVKEADLLLLDEPLMNLDYKLREELRAEMRDIFARRNAVVVYATTKPQEALLLGGHTAVFDRGRLLQFGPTLEVYHSPATVRVSEVFSDPPMNLMPATVDNNKTARISSEATFALPEQMQSLAPGEYRFGVRANHIGLADGSPPSIKSGRNSPTGRNQRLGNFYPRPPPKPAHGGPARGRAQLPAWPRGLPVHRPKEALYLRP